MNDRYGEDRQRCTTKTIGRARIDSPPLGPVELIVGNDKPLKRSSSLFRHAVQHLLLNVITAFTYDRYASSLSAPSLSVSRMPLFNCSSSQAKYRASAAPSRMWHARKPAISASVLIAFASATSEGAIMTLSY